MDYLTGICFFGPLLLIVPVGVGWGGLTLYYRFLDRTVEKKSQPYASCSLIVGSLGVMFWCLMGAILRNWIRRGLYPAWLYLYDEYSRWGQQSRAIALGIGLLIACGGVLFLIVATLAAGAWFRRRKRRA